MASQKIAAKVSRAYRTLGKKVIQPGLRLGTKVIGNIANKALDLGTHAIAAKAIGALI